MGLTKLTSMKFQNLSLLRTWGPQTASACRGFIEALTQVRLCSKPASLPPFLSLGFIFPAFSSARPHLFSRIMCLDWVSYHYSQSFHPRIYNLDSTLNVISCVFIYHTFRSHDYSMEILEETFCLPHTSVFPIKCMVYNLTEALVEIIWNNWEKQ